MDKVGEETLSHATFGLIALLQEKPYVCDIKFKQNEAVSKNMLTVWEEGNHCQLPSDLRQFYETMNGLLIQWKIKFNDDEINIGLIEINPIECLNGLALRMNRNDLTLQDFQLPEDISKDIKVNQRPIPNFNQKIMEISSDGQHGKVCLLFKEEGNIEVWLIDLSLQWHFLAPSFSHYYRMMVTHLGIRGWQFLYTEYGLTPEAKQWFSFCLPHRLKEDIFQKENDHKPSKTTNKVDFASLFKQKKKTKDLSTGTATSNEQNLNKRKKQPGNLKPRTTAKPPAKLNKASFKNP